MRLAALFGFAAAASMAGCTHVQRSSTDLVVIGHVQTLGVEPYPGDDLGMNAIITGRLSITRLISGRPPSSVLTVKYIAHMDRPTGEMRLHLRRSNEGIWLVCNDGKGRGYICS